MSVAPPAARAVPAAPIERLEALARTDPVVAPLALPLAVAYREAVEPYWQTIVPALDRGPLSDGLPLLHHQNLAVDPGRLHGLARRLVETMGEPAGGALRQALSLDVRAVVEASIGQSAEGLAQQAERAGIDEGLLSTLAQLVSLPLLLACGRAAAPQLAGARWDAGYCPVCAAWPALAERRGLERTRWLRCGRCAAEWTYALQRCPFCGNNDFKTLAYLAPEAEREARQAATCDACDSYLKSVATVRALAPAEIGLTDLSTLELDVAALQQGYTRPEAAGFPLDVHLVAAQPSRSTFFFRR